MPKLTSRAVQVARGLASTGALALAVLTVLTLEAQAQGERRACRATGYFLFTMNENVDGSVVSRTKRIDILQSDMEVVATSAGQTWSTVTDAKRWACSQAAECFVRVAAGAERCGGSPLNVVFETIRMPEAMDDWRRQVACNHARTGSIPGLRHTNANTVTLVQTKIVATASRDEITRNADATVNSQPLLESPEAGNTSVPHAADSGPRKPTPTRTDSTTSEPHRCEPPALATDSSHAPGHERAVVHRGHQVTHAARAEGRAGQRGDAGAAQLRSQEVRWWVTGEDGTNPRSRRNHGRSRDLAAPFDPKPDWGWLADARGASSGAPIHRGFFRVFRDRVGPAADPSQIKGSFTVDCNPSRQPDRR